MGNDVVQVIGRAQEAGISVAHAKKQIKLLCFLRSSDATVQCLELIKNWRHHPLVETFDRPPEAGEDQEQFMALVKRHYDLSEGGDQLLVLRRLNSARLKQVLIQLHPDEKVAKVSFPHFQLTMVDHAETRGGSPYRFEGKKMGEAFPIRYPLAHDGSNVWSRIFDVPTCRQSIREHMVII